MENSEIKNNKTQVDVLLGEIKEIGEGKLSKSLFEEKFNSLKEAVEQRNSDVDKQFGEMENNLEKKLASMVDKIGDAFESKNFKESKDEEKYKYGKCFGDFLNKVKNKNPDVKALAEGTGADGGFLVPDQFADEVLKIELESSVVRNSNARIIPMNRPILKVPALAYKSNEAGNLYGGVSAYWAEEGETLTDSKPEFERITLEPKKLIGYTEATEELDEDSMISIGGLLTDVFGEALAYEEDYNFIVGDGIGKPLGITVSPARVTVSRTTTSHVVTTDIVNMLARFRGNLNRAVWIANQSVLPDLYKLKDESDAYIWHPGSTGDISTSSPGRLYGIPIKVTEKAPALGTEGDLVLADFGHYLIGDRTGLRVELSNHYKFANDMKVWRMVKRVEGKPWLKEPITPRGGGDKLSPFVMIT